MTIDIGGEGFTATGLMVTEVRGFWDWDVSTGWQAKTLAHCCACAAGR